MKKMSKKLLATALAAAMSGLALTACSQSPSNQKTVAEASQPAKTEEPAKEVTLNFWHHYSAQSPENETLTKVLIPKFEEENPGIKVNAVSHEWADLHEKIIINASSKTLPDVARTDIAWLPEFEKMGILVPLDKEMPDFKEVSGNILENAMSTAKIKDNFYALGLNINTKILFYNQEALKKAGLSAPKTMEEMAADIKKLSGKNASGQQVWGLSEPALSGWNICPYIWSCGGSLTDEKYEKATGYINSKETVKAVQMLADLYKDGCFTGFNNGDIPMTDGFGTGRYAFILEGPWKMAEMAGAYPDFKYGTVDLPVGNGGSHSVIGGEDITMFNTANKEAAWKFMKFMTSEFAQLEMAKCGQIPVNKTALDSDQVKTSGMLPFLSAIQSAKARPPIAAWTEIDNELTTAVTAAIKGEKPVQQAMDELAVKMDTLLAQK